MRRRAQCGIGCSHELLKPVGPGARRLSSEYLLLVLSPFGEQCINVWMFNQEASACSLQVSASSAKACLTSRTSTTAGSAMGLRFPAECMLVHHLSFLTNSLRLGKTLSFTTS